MKRFSELKDTSVNKLSQQAKMLLWLQASELLHYNVNDERRDARRDYKSQKTLSHLHGSVQFRYYFQLHGGIMNILEYNDNNEVGLTDEPIQGYFGKYLLFAIRWTFDGLTNLDDGTGTTAEIVRIDRFSNIKWGNDLDLIALIDLSKKTRLEKTEVYKANADMNVAIIVQLLHG